MKHFAFIVLVALCMLEAKTFAQGVGNPHEGVSGAPQRERTLAEATENRAVPAGTVVVTVLTREGTPIANADVNLGIMRQDGQRDRRPTRTGSDGVARFEGLATGTTQAFRVNVPHEGALYSTTPFRLGPDAGYDVRVTRLPITHDARSLLQLLGFVSVEFRENRAHITQQSRLMNLAQDTYVFPQEGMIIALPAGATSPQVEAVMTDQHLVPSARGLKLTGSLPPGVVTLTWSYDVPMRGDRFAVDVASPFRTYIHRVVTDAPQGSHLRVEGFPEPTEAREEGHRLYVTQRELGPEDPLVTALHIELTDLPGPGPVRWIAIGAGLFVLGLIALFSGRSTRKAQPAISTNQDELVRAIAALDEEHASGKIGPQFHQTRRAELIDALAQVLRSAAQAQST